MNYRQLKKQYKRKHGFNPPKGYSRALIRKSIKLNAWQNRVVIGAYGVVQGLAAVVKSLKEAVKIMASKEPISQELQAEFERLGIMKR